MTGCTSAASSAGHGDSSGVGSQVNAELRRELAAWYPGAVDEDHGDGTGGFHSQFDADWNRLPGQGRFVVFQSRLTWTAAEVARQRPDWANVYLPYAEHGFQFLASQQWDTKHGGFFWEIAEPGAANPPQYQEKHAYGISFGIYAAAAVYQANHDPRALKLAVEAFRWLDAHAHDVRNGGYFEALAPDGTPVLHAPGNAGADTTKDRIGTPYGQKSMNAHIHLLESFTALYRIWPDRILRQRLEELFILVRDRFPAPPGYLSLHYTVDWKPIAGNASYGHDVETAFLLLESAEALGIKDDPATWDLAKRLWDNALKYGYDDTHGGFFNEGPSGQRATDRKKVWWVQAEALNSLLVMHEHFGQRDPRYLDAFMKTWDFTKTHQIDTERGGWNDEVSEDGTKVLTPAKSNDWKDPYHTVRALLNMSEILEKQPQRSK
ncbi:cellobiose 2-epimerase [soil metagenome]